jgi:OFA family oxalate/formate antiporter-like MFS transporter
VGIVLGGVAFVSAMFMSEPERGNDSNAGNAVQSIGVHIASATFWLLCLGMFVSTFAGLLTVGNLKPLALSVGLDDRFATLSITLFAIGNTGGRILWGQVHDRFRSRKTVMFSLGFLGIALLPFLMKLPVGAVLLTALMCGVGFGACFVVYASSIVEHFGVGLFPRLYPLCFLGYGLAGLTGPAIGGWIADATASYRSAVILSIFIIFLALGFIGVGLNSAISKTIKGRTV